MPTDNRFLQSLRLVVKPVYGLGGTLIFTHGGAAVLVLQTALSAWLQVLLIGTVCLHGYRMLRTHILLLEPDWPREIVLNAQGQWLLTDGRGVTRTAELLPDAFIHPCMVALRFKTTIGVQRVLIVRNKANADVLRRLRVRLRMRNQ